MDRRDVLKLGGAAFAVQPMPNVRSTLVTGAQLARILNLSRSRITQLRHAEGCPFVETAAGDRFDLGEVVPWYMERRGTPEKQTRPPPADPAHDEAMRRMTAIVHRAIREHVEALTSDQGLTRFLALLEALGLDPRKRYMAKRSAQLWLGTTLPSRDIAIIVEDPTGEAAAWEHEWRAAVAKSIAGYAA